MLKEKVYLNRITTVDYRALYSQAQDYFKRHGVSITFDFVPSDYQNLSAHVVQLPQGQRTILQPAMSNVVPIDTSYDFTSFAFNGREFGTNIPTGYCYTPLTQPFIDILLDDRTPEANYLCIIHEHMHGIVVKARQAGFNVPDFMDIDSLGRPYFLNNQPESPLSNFGQTWAGLKPFIATLQGATMPSDTSKPHITITRLTDDVKQTIGQLRSSDGIFGCNTLELPWKNNQQNISCIPKGTYTVKWSFMFREFRYRYQIMNVPNRSGIFFHTGNFFFDSEGCIILGSAPKDTNGDGEIDLQNSTAIVNAFEKLMNGKDFILEIL